MSREAIQSAGLAMLLCAALTGGCNDMADQPRYEPLEPSSFFDDGTSARPPVTGTVARGALEDDDAYHRGRDGRGFVDQIPVPVTMPLLLRGQERYDIHCAPCHSRLGDGLGMIVRRGFPQPPTFHADRLRQAPAGHLFDVITNGYGKMLPYAAQVDVEDRWAIIAYIRALQLSQNAEIENLPDDDRRLLEAQR